MIRTERNNRHERRAMTEAQSERRMRRAYSTGYRAAVLHQPRVPPYLGHEMKKLWLDGYDDAVKRFRLFMGAIDHA